MRRTIVFLTLALIFSFGMSPNSRADSSIGTSISNLTCPNAHVLSGRLFNDICWSCMFPIRVAGLTLFSGSQGAPADAATAPACTCGGDLSKGELPRVGLPLGFWQPTRIIEVVRRPFCFPALGGITLPDNTPFLHKSIGGTIGSEGRDTATELGFYNFHYYSFPLLTILHLLDVPQCNVGGYSDMDVLMMGEAFPNWYNDQLAAVVNPEGALFGNLAAVGAEITDCAGVTAGHVSDKIFWSAGCWGSIYPFTGFVEGNSDPIRGSSLVATKALAMLARLGIINRTVGNDVLCDSTKMPILKKSQYKLQMIFPSSEARGDSGIQAPAPAGDSTNGGTQVPDVDPSSLMHGCCHNIGASPFTWGEWRSQPGTGEDYVYVLWQWTDCCMGASL